MANLGSNRRSDRGQIILVAAFLLAVTFVVLALVVNSAIFTENLATRDDVAGSHDALDHRAEVQASVGTALTSINNENGTDLSDKKGNLSKSIDNISQAGGLHQSTQGRLVDVNWDSSDSEEGVRIYQNNASRNFSSDSRDDDWVLTDSGNFDVRNFQMNITEPEEELFPLGGSEPFRLVANDTSDGDIEWNMTVEYDGSLPTGEGLVVNVDHPNHDEVSCTHELEDDAGFVLLDVTGASIDGESCHALSQLQDEDGTPMWFGEGVDEYQIEFQNADSIQGTYSFVGDDSMSTTGADDHPEDPDEAIYSVTVDYEFYTSQVAYETDIRVAPGEVPS